jgi:hypothetical protein
MRSNGFYMRGSAYWLALMVCVRLCAQEQPSLSAIIERLDALEKQNRALTEEIQALRRQLAVAQGAPVVAPAPPAEERLQVQERRTEELAQTKVQASRRLPLSITGMLLFNAYMNTRFSGAQEFPTVASSNPVPRTAGGTARQTVLGLLFESPATVLGAKVNGSLYMDFFANPISTFASERAISNNLSRLMRLRIATVELDWGATRLLVGQDKPIISPREPNSLTHVGVSPLTSAGNPWLWQPQARLEQEFRLTESTDIRAQVGVFQTAESGAVVPEAFTSTLESSRPGFETRIAFRRVFSNDRHLEIAPGLHLSTTHVAATSVPSRLYSVDWSLAPFPKIDFSGMLFAGQNTANLGTLRQGFTIIGLRQVIPIHSIGGWGQISYAATPRLTFNVYGGQHDDRNRDLRGRGIGKNFIYSANTFYRIAPNVILALEVMQIRTTYLETGTRLNNHYDLALAYQF